MNITATPPPPHPTLVLQVEELGPMEIKILELQKSISDSAEACMQMEQHWLRQQSELVRKTRDADQQSHAVEKLNRELLILGQKRLRLDGEGKGPRDSHLHVIIHRRQPFHLSLQSPLIPSTSYRHTILSLLHLYFSL